LSIPSSGNYTLYVHSNVVRVEQFINVSVGGLTLGQVYFPNLGPNLGTPLTIDLPAGLLPLNLSFEGGQGTMNPVDYLLVVPDPPSPGVSATWGENPSAPVSDAVSAA
jgi:hypothetical protein